MGKKRILVVDDDKDCVQLVKDFLESKDYEIITAFEGETGVAKAKTIKPDLIIMDIMMPVMDGITALQRMKENPLVSKIPVIMLTSKDKDEDVLAGYKHGAEYYITKPFDLKQLILGVNLMLDPDE